MVERVFDHFGGHINDQSDLQDARYHCLSQTNNHQDQEVELIHFQTQQLSVQFSCLFNNHLSLIGPFRTLSPPTSSSGPSFHSPLFHPLQELMDQGRTLPPSLPVIPTLSHPHQPPLNPLRPMSQGVVASRKYTPLGSTHKDGICLVPS